MLRCRDRQNFRLERECSEKECRGASQIQKKQNGHYGDIRVTLKKSDRTEETKPRGKM